MYRAYAQRPAGAHQPRHPPPAGAAAGQRPAPDRADERAAVLAAGHAGPLLRRRDRHGRQHLPRRPQRRPHADAVERRPQRRLLARQPAAALPAGRSSIPEYHYEAVNVEAQQDNPHSLLWWMKRLIALRKRLPGVRPRHASSSCTRRTARCSRSSASTRTRRSWSSPTSRASSQCARARPVASSRARARSRCSAATTFPRIGELPYFLTLGPHAFYWFSLRAAAASVATGSPPRTAPTSPRCCAVAGSWTSCSAASRARNWSGCCRRTWPTRAGSAARRDGSRGARIIDAIPVTVERERRGGRASFDVDYAEGDPETYVLPLAFAPATGGRAAHLPAARGRCCT